MDDNDTGLCGAFSPSHRDPLTVEPTHTTKPRRPPMPRWRFPPVPRISGRCRRCVERCHASWRRGAISAPVAGGAIIKVAPAFSGASERACRFHGLRSSPPGRERDWRARVSKPGRLQFGPGGPQALAEYLGDLRQKRSRLLVVGCACTRSRRPSRHSSPTPSFPERRSAARPRLRTGAGVRQEA